MPRRDAHVAAGRVDFTFGALQAAPIVAINDAAIKLTWRFFIRFLSVSDIEDKVDEMIDKRHAWPALPFFWKIMLFSACMRAFPSCPAASVPAANMTALGNLASKA